MLVVGRYKCKIIIHKMMDGLITKLRTLPSSSLVTNLDAIDLIAMNEVPLKISTKGAETNK